MNKSIFNIIFCLLAVNAHAAILFQDDFQSDTLDTAKWDVTSYFSGYVTQGNGNLTLNHPNAGGAFITSKVNLVSPYEISGSFLSYPGYGINGIHLRATGQYDQSHYNDPYGIWVGFYFGTNVNIESASTTTGWTFLYDLPVSYDVASRNYFSVIDYGDSISVSLNGSLIIDKFAVDPNMGEGNKIVLADSDNWGGFPNSNVSSSFGPIMVTSVPEPTTLIPSAMLVAAAIFARRRPRSFNRNA
jgi:hypothetical protein